MMRNNNKLTPNTNKNIKLLCFNILSLSLHSNLHEQVRIFGTEFAACCKLASNYHMTYFNSNVKCVIF